MKRILFAAGASSFMATPAFAHHPLGGMPMETFTHGLLSGIGHPLLGFDHLFFIALVGIAALYTGHRLITPGAYIVAMLAGCLLMSLGVALPAKEIVIGLSLLGLGAVVLSGRALSAVAATLVFGLFGLFHGSAFGDSLAAQEAGAGTQVLIGYLIGLGVVQYAVALVAGWVAATMWRATDSMTIGARLSGAVVAGAGLLLTLENVEGMVFDLLAWSS